MEAFDLMGQRAMDESLRRQGIALVLTRFDGVPPAIPVRDGVDHLAHWPALRSWKGSGAFVMISRLRYDPAGPPGDNATWKAPVHCK